MLSKKMRSAFTLIELLVVIAVIAILSVVIILVLNPAQLLAQNRDTTRLSDMATLSTALGVYTAQGGATLGSSSVIYVSIPDPLATTTAGDQCQGLGLATLPTNYTYQCVASTSVHKVNGQGWIPVNFSSLGTGAPISQLPIDPLNQSSTHLYYTYTTNGTNYELTTGIESQKYGIGGSNDVITGDGGTLTSVYEKGSKLGLEPLDYGEASLVGYWTFDEGAGSTVYDNSGQGNNVSIVGTVTRVAGKIGSGAVNNVTPGTNGLEGVDSVSLRISQQLTISFWINQASRNSNGAVVIQKRNTGLPSIGYNYGVSINPDGTIGFQFNDGSYETMNSTGAVPLNTWTLVTVVVDETASTKIKFYINGALDSTPAYTGTMLATAYPLEMTNYDQFNSGIYQINGSLDDVRLYNRPLTATQVASMYAGGK